MIKASAGDKLGRGMSYYMVGGELARTLGPIMLSAIHELDTKMPTFFNSVYMNINFSIIQDLQKFFPRLPNLTLTYNVNSEKFYVILIILFIN